MKNFILMSAAVLCLSSCASVPQDPNHVQGVTEQSDGLYLVAGELAAIDPQSSTVRAAQQCAKLNKIPTIIKSDVKKGWFSGQKYSLLLIKCVQS